MSPLRDVARVAICGQRRHRLPRAAGRNQLDRPCDAVPSQSTVSADHRTGARRIVPDEIQIDTGDYGCSVSPRHKAQYHMSCIFHIDLQRTLRASDGLDPGDLAEQPTQIVELVTQFEKTPAAE